MGLQAQLSYGIPNVTADLGLASIVVSYQKTPGGEGVSVDIIKGGQQVFTGDWLNKNPHYHLNRNPADVQASVRPLDYGNGLLPADIFDKFIDEHSLVDLVREAGHSDVADCLELAGEQQITAYIRCAIQFVHRTHANLGR